MPLSMSVKSAAGEAYASRGYGFLLSPNSPYLKVVIFRSRLTDLTLRLSEPVYCPMQSEAFIGGWSVSAPLSFRSDGVNMAVPFSPPPPVSSHLLQTGYLFTHIPTASPPSSPHGPGLSVDDSPIVASHCG
jgi:hypothetical protein